MTGKTVLVTAGAVVALWPVSLQGQATARTDEPQVEVVHTVGCVEERPGSPSTWWLVRAAEPTVSEVGPFNQDEVEEARETPLGARELQLVGVAEFLDSDGQLAWGERSSFTTAEQANATQDLEGSGTVLVKGLLIEADPVSRINLLSVVRLTDNCP